MPQPVDQQEIYKQFGADKNRLLTQIFPASGWAWQRAQKIAQAQDAIKAQEGLAAEQALLAIINNAQGDPREALRQAYDSGPKFQTPEAARAWITGLRDIQTKALARDAADQTQAKWRGVVGTFSDGRAMTRQNLYSAAILAGIDAEAAAKVFEKFPQHVEIQVVNGTTFAVNRETQTMTPLESVFELEPGKSRYMQTGTGPATLVAKADPNPQKLEAEVGKLYLRLVGDGKAPWSQQEFEARIARQDPEAMKVYQALGQLVSREANTVRPNFEQTSAALDATGQTPTPLVLGEPNAAAAAQARAVAENAHARKKDLAYTQGYASGRGGAEGRYAAEQGELLGPKASKLMHPDTLEPAPTTITNAEATKRGFVEVYQPALAAYNDLASARTVLDNAQGLAEKIVWASTPGQAVKQGGQLYLGALSRKNPVAAAYSDSFESFLGVLSRNLGAERGVLTDRDISRIRKSMTGFTDTKDIMTLKHGIMNNVLDTAVAGARAKMFGRTVDMTSSRKRLDALLASLESAGQGVRGTQEYVSDGKGGFVPKPAPNR
jgi:hypothetical protein